MSDVALEVPLPFFRGRGLWKRGDSGASWIQMLGKALDGSAFAGCITSFKNNDKFFCLSFESMTAVSEVQSADCEAACCIDLGCNR